VLLDPNPSGVKKEGVLRFQTVSTPSTLLTQRPSLVAIYVCGLTQGPE